MAINYRKTIKLIKLTTQQPQNNGVRDVDHEEAIPGEYLEFRSDNTYVSGYPGSTEIGTWLRNGNLLTLNDGPDSYVLTIKKLTSLELQLYLKETDGNDYYETTVYGER